MELDGLNEIDDEKINKIIATYNKVLSILRDECTKKGVAFLAFGYFRSGDNLIEPSGGFYYNLNELSQFDGYLIEKKVKDLFALE